MRTGCFECVAFHRNVYGGVGKPSHMQTLKQRQGGTCESIAITRPSSSQALEGSSPARRGEDGEAPLVVITTSSYIHTTVTACVYGMYRTYVQWVSQGCVDCCHLLNRTGYGWESEGESLRERPRQQPQEKQAVYGTNIGTAEHSKSKDGLLSSHSSMKYVTLAI